MQQEKGNQKSDINIPNLYITSNKFGGLELLNMFFFDDPVAKLLVRKPINISLFSRAAVA